MFRGCFGRVDGYEGVFGVYFVSETAQVELKSGQVKAPASRHPVSMLRLEVLAATTRIGHMSGGTCRSSTCCVSAFSRTTVNQKVDPLPGADERGLTLIHFPAQRKHFLWDRACIEG